jgi:hypothetical protein
LAALGPGIGGASAHEPEEVLGSFLDAIQNDLYLGSGCVQAQHLPGKEKCHD